ncbi:MAG: hypothetical protein IPJ30_14710 [Acidobacteria bacterium]|nr:hypothetical protein [Acidobacteriota bacterium]
MKILGLLLMFGAALASTANAQWQKQTIDTKSGFRGLSVVNANVVWASGTGGTFVRTIDGGKTWTVGKVPDADKLDFRDVEAFDENTAFLLSIGNGESSRIYKTVDGGKTWKLQLKNTNEKAFFRCLRVLGQDQWDRDERPCRRQISAVSHDRRRDLESGRHDENAGCEGI